LSQYIEIETGKNELRKGLNKKQLKRVRQIIANNYFGESDERSKEILSATMVNERIRGESIDKCLKKINQEIKLLALRERRASKPLKKYMLKCPTCDKEFSCELKESPTSKGEANDILLEQLEEHEKVHKVKENKIPDPSEEKPKDKISPQQQDNKNKASLPLIIGIIAITLFLIAGIIGLII